MCSILHHKIFFPHSSNDLSLQLQQIDESIQVCVMLNQWDLAVRLGNQYNIKRIDALLAKYASHLMGKNKILDAIEVSGASHECSMYRMSP